MLGSQGLNSSSVAAFAVHGPHIAFPEVEPHRLTNLLVHVETHPTVMLAEVQLWAENTDARAALCVTLLSISLRPRNDL